MKRIASGLTFAFLMVTFQCSAQQAQQKGSPSDVLAVQATIRDYIEGYYTGDSARVERSLHPQYLKHMIRGRDESLEMIQKTGLQMIEEVRSAGSKKLSSAQKEEITVLDVNGDIASAKLVTSGWVDYLMLSKWDGQWKIVSVLLRKNI
jgi:Putative lumazine-binding